MDEDETEAKEAIWYTERIIFFLFGRIHVEKLASKRQNLSKYNINYSEFLLITQNKYDHFQ